MLDRSEASLLRAAFVVRALTIIGLFLFHGLQQSFDTSSLLLLAPHAALAPLVRWDTLYFLAAASPTALPSLVQGDAEKLSGGYAYEQVLAFQPGLVALLRAAGYAWTDGWSVNAAILGGTVAATLASIIAPLLLFRLTLAHTRSRRFALLSAGLSLLAPSPATQVAPTPEPFFAVFAFGGMLALAPAHVPRTSGPKSQGRSARAPKLQPLVFAAVYFAGATLFRSNGVLLSGFIWWALLWEHPLGGNGRLARTLSVTYRAILATILTMIVCAPFALFQFWAWARFCGASCPLFAADSRPWCTARIPLVYPFVQSHYWNVGLFRYWTVAQIPNFLLAAPVLVLAFYTCATYYASDPARIRSRTFTPWRPSTDTELARSVSTVPDNAKETANDSDSSLSLDYTSTPTLLPHIHLGLLTCSIVLFASHVQIALRFSASIPVIWWGAARIVLSSSSSPPPATSTLVKSEPNSKAANQTQNQNQNRKPHQQTRKQKLPKLTKQANALLAYLLLHGAIGLVLYAGFYPPA